MAPLREYDEALQNWMKKMKSNLVEEHDMARSQLDDSERSRSSDWATRERLATKIKNIAIKLTPPNFGKYYKLYENALNFRKENPAVPTQQEIKELEKVISEALEPKERVKDEYGYDIAEDEVFMETVKPIIETLTYFNFKGVANTEVLFKLIHRMEKKFKRLQELETRINETIKRELQEKSRKEHERIQERLKKFEMIPQNAEDLDLTGNLKLEDWRIIYSYRNAKTIDISSNPYIDSMAITVLGETKHYERVEIICSESCSEFQMFGENSVNLIKEIDEEVEILKNGELQLQSK